jgi:hypothetical protein
MINKWRAIPWVICRRNGEEIARYDFKIPATLDDSKIPLPANDELIIQAKGNLNIEGKAAPPYAHIEFEVIW